MIDFLLRLLPFFKGKQRLARFLLQNKIRSGKELIVKGKSGHTYVLPNSNENIGFEILINGIYEADTISFICERIKSGSVFLDIGANIGAISIPVSAQRSDVDVVALEAAPWIFEYLKVNIKANNLHNIQAINKAISNKAGSQVDFFSPRDKFGKGSLAPVFTSAAVKVETTTLDILSSAFGDKPIGLIKVDVEGFEALAFRGGSNLLSNSGAPDILFEFVDWAEELGGEKPGSAQLLMLDYGYELYLFEHGKIGLPLKAPLNNGSCMVFATKNK
jgi:FkbM family methyltransferase